MGKDGDGTETKERLPRDKKKKQTNKHNGHPIFYQTDSQSSLEMSPSQSEQELRHKDDTAQAIP